MSDIPIPDELVDRLARIGIPASERRPDALDRQRVWNMLQALAEWADGGLIAPSTWTVVEAERETGLCVYWGHRLDCECDYGARWVLSPREGEHERCPAGICRRPAGHAGPHSDLPREGER